MEDKKRGDKSLNNVKVTDLGNVLSLDFSNLRLEAISFQPYFTYRNLGYLYLGGNKLTELDPGIFENYPSLSWLDVRDNRLSSFPTTVKEHPRLATLLLSGNLLRTLPIELGSVPHLRGLMVSGNPLEYPPPDILKTGPMGIIFFLKNQWFKSNRSSTKPGSGGKGKKRNPKKVEKMSKEDDKIYINMLEYIMEKKLKELLQNQEKELQLIKDKEELKRWRKQYQYDLSKASEKNYEYEAPFAIYPDYMKTASRKDLQNPNMKVRQITAPSSKDTFDIDGEISKMMTSLKELHGKHYDKDSNPSVEMSASLNDISKIKAIMKKLNWLKSKV